MKIQTEQDMKQFCYEVNSSGHPFYVNKIRTLPHTEVQSRMEGILKSEPAEKVTKFQSKGREKELYIQGIKDISYDGINVTVDEIPVIYPSGRAKDLECPMTGILVNCYTPVKNLFLLHMRGKDISTPFGFQGAAAGFIDFGDTAFQTALEEVAVESQVSVQDPNNGKALAILPFMKSRYPQPLFLYGFEIYSKQDSEKLPILNSMEDISDFERSVKAEISKTNKTKEAYPFFVPENCIETIIQTIYARDPSQQGKNGGFFGPIRESLHIFMKSLASR
jgi:hypothetical protein